MQNTNFPSASPFSASRPGVFRIFLTLACATLLLALAGLTFWFQDVRYSLPTPKPPSLLDRHPGERVVLPDSLLPTAGDQRPVFLHFFNPECPCSRFNANHVRALQARFGTQARFVAVVQIADGQNAAQQQASLGTVAKLFGHGIIAVLDDGGRIAAACGVYSTPQAVILTAGPEPALLFRGNYNASRYCADPQTEFARQALTAVVSHQGLPPESRAAMIAYGCELPANLSAAKHVSAKAKL